MASVTTVGVQRARIQNKGRQRLNICAFAGWPETSSQCSTSVCRSCSAKSVSVVKIPLHHQNMEQEGPPRQTTLFACGVTSGKAASSTSIRKNRKNTTKPFRAPASNENLDDQPKPSGSKKNKIFDRKELKKSDNLIVGPMLLARHLWLLKYPRIRTDQFDSLRSRISLCYWRLRPS